MKGIKGIRVLLPLVFFSETAVIYTYGYEFHVSIKSAPRYINAMRPGRYIYIYIYIYTVYIIAVKRLITSKVKVFVYIISVILCIFIMYININTCMYVFKKKLHLHLSMLQTLLSKVKYK